MEQKPIHLLLITEELATKQKIETLCSLDQENTYEINVSSNFIPESVDIIFIAKDKIDLLLDTKSKLPECPIIYLHEEKSLTHSISAIKTHANEIIDMSKITAIGFSRAIAHATEKYFIQHGLTEQKDILSQLVDTTENGLSKKQSADANTVELSTKNLIEENKKLIDLIKKKNEELQHLVRIDLLTKIGNRLGFNEAFTRMIEHSRRHKHLLGMLMLDLDKFKIVNDTYGHQIGDLLLQETALRFQNCLRKSDYIARLGGDEFAIVLNEIKSPHAAGLVAWKILQQIRKPFYLNDIEIRVDASIGIACYPLSGERFEDLVKSADVAMYKSKKSTTVKYTYANPDLQSSHIKKVEIVNELATAIDNNELNMVYQPIYEIPSRRLHGFEALIRWKNKNLGQISPAEFIPIAEDSGLIHPISRWIFQTVCRQISQWKTQNDFSYKISINLSPSQLAEKDLLNIINEVTQKNNVPLSVIEFEITEMAAMQENEAMTNTIKNLHDLGASHAIDNFGTGYFSVKNLKLLPVSTIKIDMSLVQGVGINEADTNIVSSIIALAKKMGLKVIAEGVETQQQLDLLLAEKCDYTQGYLFSKPMMAEQAFELMAAEKLKK